MADPELEITSVKLLFNAQANRNEEGSDDVHDKE
jgi:hypothetical protein